MSRYKDSTELFLNNFQKFKNKFDCLKIKKLYFKKITYPKNMLPSFSYRSKQPIEFKIG